MQTLAAKAIAGDTTACIWITKAPAGWREQPQQVEHSGRDCKPIKVERKAELINKVMGLLEAANRSEPSYEAKRH